MPSGSVPGPVYVLRAARGRMDRAGRYRQISRILAWRGLLPYARGGRGSELATPEGRARLARLVQAMEDGGVTFVKLGQVLSTRRDLLPAEFTGELSRLQDDAAGVPWPGMSRRCGPSWERRRASCSPASTPSRSPPRPSPRSTRRLCCPGPGRGQGAPSGCQPDRRQGSGYHRAARGPAGAQHELGPGGRRGRAGRRVRRRPARRTRPAGRGAQHDLGGRRIGQPRPRHRHPGALPAAAHRPGAGDGAPGRTAAGHDRPWYPRRGARRAGPRPAGLPAPPGHAGGDLPRRPAPGYACCWPTAGSGCWTSGPSVASTPGCAPRCSGCCWPWTGATRPGWPTRCWKSLSGPGSSTSRAWNGCWPPTWSAHRTRDHPRRDHVHRSVPRRL